MIYNLVLALATLVALIVGSIFPHPLLLAGAAPDFLLLLVVFNGMFRGPGAGGLTGFIIGLTEDLFLGRLIGLNALAKAVVGMAVGDLTKSIFKENLWVPVINIGWATLLDLILVFLVGRLAGNQWPIGMALWQGIFETIYNVCLVPFLYGPFFNFADKQLRFLNRE